MSETVVSVPAIAVPGLKIAYQIQIGEGQALAYEAAVDSTVAREDLDELLDRLGAAAERRKAMHDLPFHQARLAQNREQLPKRRKELADAIARAEAKVAVRSAGRRNVIEMAPNDMNTVAQYEARVAELEATIRNDEIRIPYLRAIIAGREPPDLFPEIADTPALAAE